MKEKSDSERIKLNIKFL